MRIIPNTPENAVLHLLEAYAEHRNVQETLDCLTEDVLWIGTSGKETARGKAALRALISAEIERDGTSLTFAVKHMTCSALRDSVSVLHADIGFTRSAELEITAVARMTFSCVREGDAILIASVHTSFATNMQEDGEFYPVRFAEKKLKEQLSDYEKQLELYRTCDGSGVFSAVCEDGFPLLYGNDRYYQIHEYTPASMRSTLKNRCLDYVFSEDQARVQETVCQALDRRARHVEWQMRIMTGKGHLKYILVSAVLDYGQTQTVLNGIVVDMTLQHELEAKLNQTAAQYDALLKNMPGGVAMYELGNPIKLVYFNDAVCSVVGYSRTEYAAENQRGVLARIHPDDLEDVERFASLVSESTSPVSSTHRFLHKCGEYRWLKATGCRIEMDAQHPMVYMVYTDVDQEKRAEQELLEQEIAYRLATENTDINMWQYDVAGNTLYLTENAKRVHHETDAVVQNFPESVIARGMVRQDSVEPFRQMCRELQNGQARTTRDIWFRDGTNASWWCERITYMNILDHYGKPTRAVGVGKNITAEYAALEKFQEMEQKYQQEMQYHQAAQSEKLLIKARSNITRNIVESYVCRDGVGICQDGANYAAGVETLAQYAFTAEEQVRIHHFLDRERILAAFEAGETSYELDYRRRLSDGSVIWVNAKAKTYQDPATKDVMSFLYTYDINEEKIKEGIIRTVSALEHDFILYIDLKKDAYQMYLGNKDGVALPEREGSGYWEMMEKNLRETVVAEELDRAIRDLHPRAMMENLRDRQVFSAVYPTLDAEGTLRQKRIEYAYLDAVNERAILTRSDVTDLINQQKQQQEILRGALAAAEQANSAKSDFLSRMSHEIRTPMNAIIGMSAIAAQSIGDDAQVADCISKIGISSRFLLSLINDILDMSRIESGKVLLKSEKIPFEEFLNGVNSICYTQAAAREVDYETVVDPNVEDFYIGDAMKLQQVVINILSNAVKFTPEHGKVSLNVHQLRRNKSDAVLRFVINDTGCGISDDFLPHLFEPFTQEHAETTTLYGGTGLGLAICKSLVSMMDGNITVRSIVGVGTEFTVDVKLGVTEESRARYLKRPHYNFSELKALVVDDDVTVCEHAVITLKEIGVTSEWVDSGRKAVDRVQKKWAKKEYYDLVLVDWKMPEMDGIETARRIRAIVGPEVTIIIMTAYDWSAIEHEAKMAGVNLLMSKPMFKSSLISAFERAFYNHQAQLEPSIQENFDFTGKRVLLAEDHPLNVEVAKKLLERKGFTVDHAENGLRALEMFTSSPVGYYDVILMDIRMPEMDGLQSAYNIRHWRKDDAKTIPIIAMTANAFDDDIQKSKAAGMNAHLAKPIEPRQLFQTLFDFLHDRTETD